MNNTDLIRCLQAWQGCQRNAPPNRARVVDGLDEVLRALHESSSASGNDAAGATTDGAVLHKVEFVLNALSLILLDVECIRSLCATFRPFTLDLVARLVDQAQSPAVISKFGSANDKMEHMCVVFAHLVAVAPKCLPQIVGFLRANPDPFEVLRMPPTPMPLARLRALARAMYVLTTASRDTFRGMWSWAPFIKLCGSTDVKTRFFAVHVTTIVLGIPPAGVGQHTNVFEFYESTGLFDMKRQDMDVDMAMSTDDDRATDAPSYRIMEISAVVQEETKSMAMDSLCLVQPTVQRLLTASYPHGGDRNGSANLQVVPLHHNFVSVEGVILARKSAGAFKKQSRLLQPVVPVGTTKTSLRALASVIHATDFRQTMPPPVLIKGVSGSGKSSTLLEIARLTGNDDLIELYLDEQMDSKTLIGTYVCTDLPGEFKWQAGSLTRAIQEGRWVFIKDVDQMPVEIMAGIAPLLETGVLKLPGGDVLEANTGFRVFGTQTSMGKNFDDSGGGGVVSQFLKHLWKPIDLQPLQLEEVSQIIAERYGDIPVPVVKRMLDTFRLFADDTFDKPTTADLDLASDDVSAAVTVSEEDILLRQALSRCGLRATVRDLLKWCERLMTGLFAEPPSSVTAHLTGLFADTGTLTMSAQDRESIFAEGFDCLCAGIPSLQTRLAAATQLAKHWDVREEGATTAIVSHVPTMQELMNGIKIGRVMLYPSSPEHGMRLGASSNSMPFTYNGHSLRLMERIGSALNGVEPVLLVGQTGCGKTTVVQQLANLLGSKLVVQNLNVQSDSSDLLGGEWAGITYNYVVSVNLPSGRRSDILLYSGVSNVIAPFAVYAIFLPFCLNLFISRRFRFFSFSLSPPPLLRRRISPH
jgi:midasin